LKLWSVVIRARSDFGWTAHYLSKVKAKSAANALVQGLKSFVTMYEGEYQEYVVRVTERKEKVA